MRRLSFGAVALCAVVTACADQGSEPTTATRSTAAPLFSAQGNAIDNSYIVVLNDGANPRSVAAIAGVNPHYVYTAAVNGFSAELNQGQLNALQHNPNVAYVEQDAEMLATTTQSGATWGLDRLDQRALPLNTTYNYGNTGAGVTAYIVDTGILFAHTEFGGRAVKGYDAVTANGTAQDCNGHGTHVAGTVGGSTYGVAKGVSLVAVRVLDCNGSGSTAGVIAGVDWVANNAVKPAVANMSLGGGASTTLDNAVKNAIARGVTFGVAAGNGNFIGIAQDACKSSPARVPEAITVGATDKTDTKASWSNYGACVDFFGPGVGITSSWYTSSTATNTISGTSMATPHVVGVAALYVQSNPTATPQQVRDALFANTTKNVVKNSKTTNAHLLFSNY
ncbi:MAG TPA: S8 family peptidase [Longimicrobiales bacterium]|nr:S8 family peptidase [Longimicrobiales bacterium]